MILTVTLNAALDVTYRLPGPLLLHGTNRPHTVWERAGGKGLNVARVLAALGHDTVVTGFAGGGTGREIRADLARSEPRPESHPEPQPESRPESRPGSVADALVEVSGTSRRTVTVVDGTGDATIFNEQGPRVDEHEWKALLGTYQGLLAEAEAVALCGSAVPGADYRPLVRAARERGVPVLLDTSGWDLTSAVRAGPDIIKPNADELASMIESERTIECATPFLENGLETLPGRPSRDVALRRAVARLRDRGTDSVVASLGPEGVLAFTPEGAWRALPPQRLSGNPTGAGDSAVAGLLSGLVEGLPWPQRLTRAVALSAASVLAPVAGAFDPDAYAAFLRAVTVSPVES